MALRYVTYSRYVKFIGTLLSYDWLFSSAIRQTNVPEQHPGRMSATQR